MKQPKDIEELKVLMNTLIDSHEQELLEIKEDMGNNNVDDFYYSDHRGTWILTFIVGDDEEFSSKEEMMEWLRTEGDE